MKQKSTGTKRATSAGSIGKSRTLRVKSSARDSYFAICVRNKGNEASLELGKAYRVIKSNPGDPGGRIRVVDEDGEDYLYLADWFVPIEVSPQGRRRVLEAVAG